HPSSLLFFFYFYPAHLALHSFPTRRSSDLHPLAGRLSDLQGLPRLPGLDLRLAERDGRARHPWPLCTRGGRHPLGRRRRHARRRSEEHTSELQSPDHLVCRLLLEKKKTRHT